MKKELWFQKTQNSIILGEKFRFVFSFSSNFIFLGCSKNDEVWWMDRLVLYFIEDRKVIFHLEEKMEGVIYYPFSMLLTLLLLYRRRNLDISGKSFS